MNAVGLALALFFVVCGAGIVLGTILPERRVPVVLAWAGSLAAVLALWASGAVLASGDEFRHSLWTIPSIGTLTVLLDRVSAFFLFIAAVVVLASSVFSAAYMKRYAGHYSLAAFGWYLALCASMRRGSKRFAFAYLECTCKWIFDCWVQHGRTHSQTETMSCCIRLLNFSSTGFQSGFPSTSHRWYKNRRTPPYTLRAYNVQFPCGGTFMPSKTSRREFLSAGLMLPVVGASSRMGLWPPSGKSTEMNAGSSVKLDYKTLGRTGLKVTTVGFGCMITSDPSVIERAADLGISYFDTARGYQHGNNERMVGAALGAKRKQIVLSTKSGAQDKEGLQKDLETSLRELNTDYVDIWYLHGKGSPADIRDDMIEAQQLAKKQGKIRFAGVSTHGGQQELLPWLAQKGVFDVVLTAYNFSMDTGMEQAIGVAARAGMGVVGMKVMAGGFRSLKPGNPLYRKLQQDGALLAALKWVINKPNVSTTIPSMTDMDQLDENLKAMAHPFSEGDAKLLAAHLEMIRPLYCRMCGKCEGACQKGLPVADVLRSLTYADGYGQFALGRERFLELTSEQVAVRCGDCTECTVECPFGVQVSSRMARAQELFA